jgi:hypothetical protein
MQKTLKLSTIYLAIIRLTNMSLLIIPEQILYILYIYCTVVKSLYSAEIKWDMYRAKSNVKNLQIVSYLSYTVCQKLHLYSNVQNILVVVIDSQMASLGLTHRSSTC